MKPLALLLISSATLFASTKLVVTVVEQKTGKAVTGLKAGDFTVSEDKAVRRVEAAEYTSGLLDIMMLVDSSLVGPAVQPVATSLIGQLQEKDQMAVVAFHSSADLIQDFTASRELLMRALSGVKYGNTPRVLDALYAAIDGGFRTSNFRRVVILLTTGYEGPSRTSEREVVKLARHNGVSIYPVYVTGASKGMLENLARQTGGASFRVRDSKAPDIFDVVRGCYSLTLQGNLALGDKLKVEVKRAEKVAVSAMPVE
jgi:VWFA-related protein